MEKNNLFEILNDWNFWDKDIPKYIGRTEYQNNIHHYQKSGEIVIIKGIRRSGKSTLLINYISELVDSGFDKKQFLFVNFEDPRFIGSLDAAILDEIIDVYKEFINEEDKPHLFLDEIQNVIHWEKWVRTAYELNKAFIYITGSSSRLLSKEFGTALSGRYLDINIFPLSFKEYLKFKDVELPGKSSVITQKLRYKKLFNNYKAEGGFPKVVLLEDDLKRKESIMYYETIILKDVVARHNLKNQDNVNRVALYLLSNIGKPLNINKIRKSLNISYEMTEKYFEYLKDTYMLYEINQFNYSLKKQFANRRKVYCADASLIENISFRITEDYGRLIENIVFLELKRRGLDIYFHHEKRECDFVIKKGLRIVEAIQVTKSIENAETRERELNGLLDALYTYDLHEGMILTENEEQEFVNRDKKIVVKPIWKFLLGF